MNLNSVWELFPEIVFTVITILCFLVKKCCTVDTFSTYSKGFGARYHFNSVFVGNSEKKIGVFVKKSNS